MDLLALKKQVLEIGMSLIESKMAGLHAEMKNFQAAANNETKSSAGDKYETGRAMMQLEKDKVASLLGQLDKQKKVLGEINPTQSHETVRLGSIVMTDNGCFYLSVSLGKLSASQDVFCISPVSPLGQAMLGKKAESTAEFNGRKYHIQSVA
ncbi:MAG: GreA/GreB family elongation factor [Cyclobacteriaceae bacterium]